jgi:hypothetical protein
MCGKMLKSKEAMILKGWENTRPIDLQFVKHRQNVSSVYGGHVIKQNLLSFAIGKPFQKMKCSPDPRGISIQNTWVFFIVPSVSLMIFSGYQWFCFQFCDVVQVTIIHKYI